MTPQEFKAWFEGFTEALDGLPGRDQWKRIKERVAEIDGQTVTEKVFIDRYWRPYWHYNPYGTWTSYNNAQGGVYSYNVRDNGINSIGTPIGQNQAQVYLTAAKGPSSFNSMQAMADAGRLEGASFGQVGNKGAIGA